MVIDLGLLDRSMADVQKMLDHKMLNKIEALGLPTLENLSRFIWDRVQHAGRMTRVTVHRDSCNESCTYYGPQAEGFGAWTWPVIEERKTRARAWFEHLRDDICTAFESSKTMRRQRSIPAMPAASCARLGTAPTIPASPAAAA